MDNGDYYEPDFWLPRMKMWLEVKGCFPNKREIRVARKLQFHTGFDVAICYERPLENDVLLFGRSDENGGILTETWMQWKFDDVLDLDPGPVKCSPRLCYAANMAREAKFQRADGNPQKSVVDWGNIPF